MFSKSYSLFFLLVLVATGHAHEYGTTEGIHRTDLTSTWCGNLILSTKVGKKTANGVCNYTFETVSTGVDYCGPFYLNAFLLEKNAGLGFDCAATHVYSNVSKKDGLDEYLLLADENGHYIDTHKPTGHINLE
ncbi:MAG: hypothetical protein H0U75_03440 [Legionella sp.]|nr:hypothetical protein [Legionella sp.]